MSFEFDRQTLNDLDLLEKSKGKKSILSFFLKTQSLGGRELLRDLFYNPMNSIQLIEDRVALIKHFQDSRLTIEINKEFLIIVESYFSKQLRSSEFSIWQCYIDAVKNAFNPKNDYYIDRRGIKYLIIIIQQLHDLASNAEIDQFPEVVKRLYRSITETIDNTSLKDVLSIHSNKKLTLRKYKKINTIFRRYEINNVRRLLRTLYEIDVFTTIAGVVRENEFTLPIFTEKNNSIETKGIYHPFIENPVKNDFIFDSDKRICFITGPNMVGKSTFMKALGLSIYLSHLGFPVPASDFKVSLFNGIFTTINLPDNIDIGYSHFYNEVLRIKELAEKINTTGNLFVVYDELFRGTNIKDAFEASVAVIEAFSKIQHGAFIISTHIVEAAEMLKENPSIFFKYFEANIIDDSPQYNYRLKDGVTSERIGMYLLRKEKVLETIIQAKRNYWP